MCTLADVVANAAKNGTRIDIPSAAFALGYVAGRRYAAGRRAKSSMASGPLGLASAVLMNNGSQFPLFGLGTWLSNDDEAFNATLCALRRGYVHIDTAAMYKNEEQIGRALREWDGRQPFVRRDTRN